MNPPNWREWLYSAKAFSASMLALFIALSLHLPNPYWAVSTVYIVSHPLSGATSSKAAFRVFGTVLGASASVVLVPLLASTPIFLSVAIAVWTGVFLYLAMLIRTPASYAFLLSGYTLPLVSFPSLLNPAGVFDVGLARTEEIVIGIVCSAVVSSVVFPNRIAPVMTAQIGRILHDAAEWAGAVLTPAQPRDEDVRVSHKLVADVVALDALIVHLSFDSVSQPQAGKARAIRQRLTMLVPQLSGLLDPLLVPRDSVPEGERREIESLVAAVVAWMKRPTDTEGDSGYAPLHADIEARRTRIGPPADAASLWSLTVLARLDELMSLWCDCRDLEASFRRGDLRREVTMRYDMPPGVGRTAQHDHPMLVYKAVSVVVCVICAALLWLHLGWEAGTGGVVSVAVAYCFFAALDDPVPGIRSFFDWLAVGTAVGFVYIFAILPGVHTFTGLALVLAPPLLIIGAFTGRPQLTGMVMLFMVQSISELGIKEAYTADFETFINTSVGSLIGCAFPIVWAAASNPFGIQYLAGRQRRANWRDLERAAGASGARDMDRIAARMVDRSGQMLPRLATLDNASALRDDSTREVRVLLRLRDLYGTLPSLSGDERQLIGRVMQQLAAYFRSCRRSGARVDLPPTLLPCIDTAISGLLGTNDPACTRAGIDLTSLRFSLSGVTPLAS